MKKACQHLDLKAFVLDLLFVDDQVSWTTAYISRDPDSKELQTHLESHALQGVSPVHLFHSRTVDVLSLKRVKKLTPSTFEAQIEATTEFDDGETNVIAKVARFEWEIPRFERETAAYKLLSHRDATSRLVPRFLAHVAEHGRVIGFLLAVGSCAWRCEPVQFLGD